MNQFDNKVINNQKCGSRSKMYEWAKDEKNLNVSDTDLKQEIITYQIQNTKEI